LDGFPVGEIALARTCAWNHVAGIDFLDEFLGLNSAGALQLGVIEKRSSVILTLAGTRFAWFLMVVESLSGFVDEILAALITGQDFAVLSCREAR
jgi:hypothetical protein